MNQTLPPYFLEKIPPQSLETERTVLGSMLTSVASVDVALELCSEDCFYQNNNRKIFCCMRDMYEKNIPIDLITLAAELRRQGILEEVGAEPYLGELSESVCTSANIEYYAKELIEKSTLRGLIGVAGEITTDCFGTEKDAAQILDSTEEKIFGISERRIKNKFESSGQLLGRTFEEIEGYTRGETGGVSTGFEKVDEIISGMQNGDLIIVAGRPSMGKTAFALSMITNAAIKLKIPSAIFSLEMSKSQLMQRVLCSEARVNFHLLRRGLLPKRDIPKLSFAAGPIAEAGLFIDDTPAITVLELRAKARRLKAKEGIGLIVVDYMQLMGSTGKQENRQQEIANISRSLKAVAKELDVPVIALSQLSRAVESRTKDHRPQLSDLRESGAIEQDADVVMFVYREEVYNKKDESLKNTAEIIVGKQRNGPVGTANLAFIKEFVRFENMTTVEDGSWA